MSEFEEFTVEEEGGRSPFLPLLALLGAILVLAVICAAILLFARGLDTVDDSFIATSTAIAIANATTEAQNAQVTLTVMALTEEASRPTDTPTATPEPPTSTPTPTSVIEEPTETPVVQEPGETGTPVLDATSIFPGDLGATATPITGVGGTPGTGGELPDTGLGVAEALAIALGLVALFVIARRLRTG